MNKTYDFRILVIDDNPEIHQDFIKILTGSQDSSHLDVLGKLLFQKDGQAAAEKITLLPQFQIETATQGQAGVEKIAAALKQGKPYALAFVDIRMPPGWDGIETIKHIWELDKDIQIVICTAYSDYTWEETVTQLGQNDNLLILKKPFDHIAVRQLACALTRKWKLMQQAQVYTESLEKTVLERTEELQYQATHDSLTGLPNRALLYDRIEQAIKASEIDHSIFAILFFDLDRFKLINDSLSHAAGDALLISAAKRLQTIIRSTDTIARLGGDEFIILITHLSSVEEITAIASSLMDTLKNPFTIEGHDLTITTSMGIAIYPKDGETAETLLRNADASMYYAKESGGKHFQFYSDKISEELSNKLRLQSDLSHALKNNELSICYQPQIDLKQNKVVAVEALARWTHPEFGEILPIKFIPLAEECDLIIPLGEWVLREACRQNKIWQDSGLPRIRVAVNVTSPQLRQPSFTKTVKTILSETGLHPDYLELELTENVILNNIDCVNTINELKEMGVHFAIDDFGTGYSSLSYLRSLPLDRLKIDRSFIQNIKTEEDDEVIIHAIIAMAKSLNLEVLAEGVENPKQLQFLKAQQCDEVQGFYFSKPLSALELEDLLKDTSELSRSLEEIK